MRTKRFAALLGIIFCTVAAAPPGTRAEARVRLDADGFRLAMPGWSYQFPQDHAAHPSFRIEWWYYTGHLRAGNKAFGYEATFFRVALPVPTARPAGEPSAWRARHVLFRHLALTDEAGKRFLFDDRAERHALDLAGADSTRYLTWIGDDYVGLEADRRTHRVVGRAPEFALDLHLVPEKPPVIHGDDGVSRKSGEEGQASHYYSLTRLATRGRLVRGRDTLAVEGRSWMDHEWSSSRLRDTHAGWDWFSVQLSDGRDLMLYRLRRKSGEDEPVSSGTLVAADGAARHLPLDAFEIRATGRWKSPESGGDYPSGWIVRVPSAGLDLTLEPVLADQELRVPTMNGIVYWEGRVRVRGTSAGRAVSGEGYVELTGYAGPAPG